MRLALLTDKPLLMSFIKVNHEKLGYTPSKNFILLKNCDNKMMILDLEREPDTDIEEWINRNSLDVIHSLDVPHIAQLADMIKAPTLLIFAD